VSPRHNSANGNANAPEDFSAQLECILEVVQEWPQKGKGVLQNLLLGLGQRELTDKHRLRVDGEKHKRLYGSWRQLIDCQKKECLQEFIDICVMKKLLKREMSSFQSGTYSVGYETVTLTPQGIQFLQTGGASDAAAATFPAPKLLRDFRIEREEKKKAVMKEIQEWKDFDITSIPREELEKGEGVALQAERKWRSCLSALERAGAEQRDPRADLKLAACKSLVTNVIEDWRLEEAERLKIAYGTILPDMLVKRIAYASTVGRVSVELLFESGVRMGDTERLAKRISEWIDKDWMPLKNAADAPAVDGGATSDTPAEKRPAGGPDPSSALPLPYNIASWVAKKFNVPSVRASKMTATVQESATLFCQGLELELVAVKRLKQIAPATVEGHLMTAFMNGMQPLAGEEAHIKRFFEAVEPFPSKQQWDLMETAFLTAGVDYTTGKDTKTVVEALGGDGAKWYGKLRWYKCLRDLEYPIEEACLHAVPSAAKRQRTA